MRNPTQKDIILCYVKIRGSITPATMSDADKSYFGPNMFLGSETGRRCRELRDENPPRLKSVKVGKFEQFYFPDQRQTGFKFGGVLLEEDNV